MVTRRTVLFSSLPFTVVLANAQESPQDQLLQITRDWLLAISKGDRATLNRIMDHRFLATTPAGDVLSKDRLVPDDENQSVQRLPALSLAGPMVRVYGETAVLMSRLQPANGNGPSLNGTFVYGQQGSAWKLLALHLSAQK